jgi:hypothetical protein
MLARLAVLNCEEEGLPGQIQTTKAVWESLLLTIGKQERVGSESRLILFPVPEELHQQSHPNA